MISSSPVHNRTQAQVPYTDEAFLQFTTTVNNTYARIRGLKNNLLCANVPVNTSVGGLYLSLIGRAGGAWQEQYHNCRCCLKFLNTVGHVVYLDDNSQIHTIWEEAADLANPYGAIATSLHDAVKRWVKTKNEAGYYFEGPFVQEESKIGLHQQGGYFHFHILFPRDSISHATTYSSYRGSIRSNLALIQTVLTKPYTSRLNTAHAVSLVNTGKIHRSEKVLGLLNHWLALLADLEGRVGYAKEARLWRHARHAINGLSHLCNTVAGQLLERLNTHGDNAETIAAINSMLSPYVYQRPQAAPSEQNVERAATIVDTLGLGPSLERRKAHLSDITHFVWKPKIVPAAGKETKDTAHLGAFEKVKTKTKAKAPPLPAAMQWPPPLERAHEAKTVTHVYLRDRLLPHADEMLFYVNNEARSYTQMMAPVHPDSPLIFRWPNLINQYVYTAGSPPANFNLAPRTWVKVLGLIAHPEFWDSTRPSTREILLLEGCYDKREGETLALFPEVLRAELHEVRAAIEGLNKASVLPVDPKSVGGFQVDNNKGHCTYMVAIKSGPVVDVYKIDRFE
jgi:hypothetical protein